jgi:signal peptidase I
MTDAANQELLPPASKPGTPSPSLLQQVYQCLSVATLAMGSYFVISHFVFQTVRVVGVSMVPTLYDSQQYVLNRWVYYFRAPNHNDVVVLRDPIDHGFAVKRIIGTSGDRIRLKDGKVYVNGTKLEEPYLLPGMPTFPCVEHRDCSVTLGEDEYFVLGDNRKNSADSRTYGPVSRRSILGLIVR